MDDNFFRFSAVIIFLIAASISVYFRRKADREGGEKITLKEEGTAMMIGLRVIGFGGWLAIFAYMLNPRWMDWSRLDIPEWVRWVGLLMGVLADFLAWWVFTNLENNVTPTVVTRQKAQLVTSGPYRWVRHSLYVMGLIATLGFALLAENWFILLTSSLGFALLVRRASSEEDNLIDKFGDEYRVYMKNTGRFFPKLMK